MQPKEQSSNKICCVYIFSPGYKGGWDFCVKTFTFYNYFWFSIQKLTLPPNFKSQSLKITKLEGGILTPHKLNELATDATSNKVKSKSKYILLDESYIFAENVLKIIWYLYRTWSV